MSKKDAWYFIVAENIKWSEAKDFFFSIEYNSKYSNLDNDQKIKICIDSDRTCSILGELWMGTAQNCNDAIFLAVGTGIGAGILANGKIVRGFSNAAGAIGWLALDKPFKSKYVSHGCLEYHASGEGIARITREYLEEDNSYNGVLKSKPLKELSSHDVFKAQATGDSIAEKALNQAIEFWGMTIANLVSLFNPEKIILGGGMFGPGLKFKDKILCEARKWAQPLSIKQVRLEESALGSDAALFGAGHLALKSLE